MTLYRASDTNWLDHLFRNCLTAYQETIREPSRRETLCCLADTSSHLELFVRHYDTIEDPSINTDDEILNWVFSEVPADLSSALWLLTCGFYKASAASLRNALDISVASLYFQIRENEQPPGSGYNEYFSDWDKGRRQTPNWGETKPLIKHQPAVVRFLATNGIDVVELVYEHFRYLCAYTHTAAFAANGDPVTAINTTGSAPAFDERYFDRGCELMLKTMSYIAILWQITFPEIVDKCPLGPLDSNAYDALFPGPLGSLALAHR